MPNITVGGDIPPQPELPRTIIEIADADTEEARMERMRSRALDLSVAYNAEVPVPSEAVAIESIGFSEADTLRHSLRAARRQVIQSEVPGVHVFTPFVDLAEVRRRRQIAQETAQQLIGQAALL